MPYKSKATIHPETESELETQPMPEQEPKDLPLDLPETLPDSNQAPEQEPEPETEQVLEHYYSVKTVHGNFQNAVIGTVPKVAGDSPLRAKVRKHAYNPHQPRGYDASKVLLALEWQTYSEMLVALFRSGCGETELSAWESKIFVVTGTDFERTLTNPVALKCLRSGGSRTTQARRLCAAFIEVYGDTSAEQVLERIVPHNSELNFALTCHLALMGTFDQPKTRRLEVAA